MKWKKQQQQHTKICVVRRSRCIFFCAVPAFPMASSHKRLHANAKAERHLHNVKQTRATFCSIKYIKWPQAAQSQFNAENSTIKQMCECHLLCARCWPAMGRWYCQSAVVRMKQLNEIIKIEQTKNYLIHFGVEFPVHDSVFVEIAPHCRHCTSTYRFAQQNSIRTKRLRATKIINNIVH